MNILYCTFEFPKLSETFILTEIVELVKNGHNVAVFAHTNPKENIVHESLVNLDIPVYYAGVPSYSISDFRRAMPALFSTRFLRFGQSPLEYKDKLINAYLSKMFEKCLDDLDWVPDLIHAHFVNKRRLPIVYIANHQGIPMSVTAHAFGLYDDPKEDALQQVFELVDGIIVPTEYNRNHIVSKFCPSCSIEVVPAISALDEYNPRGDTVDKRILTVARMVEKKGYEFAISAVSQVADDFPDLEYHIVGNGERFVKLKEQVAKEGLQNQVKFLQNVSDERLWEEYNDAEIFLLPCIIAESGDRDGLPVVLKEAMAMKTACLSTTISGIPELIEHEKTGLLVPPKDTGKLSKQLARLLSDPDLRESLAEAGQESSLMKNDLEKTISQLEGVFREFQS